ncbi:MAG TPA: PEP/pyruvate-binding domain-containing protein, partial [Fusibacter sp.]|nr:PEP/pyruvate-binding domain-containing protein [Fusibacter sp.]
MSSFVLGFHDIDKSDLVLVGGKGSNLGELTKIEQLSVPDGFCVTTEAFKSIIDESHIIRELLDQLSNLTLKDRIKIAELSGEIRSIIEKTSISEAIEKDVSNFLDKYGVNDAYAVRSSATAEDLPSTSFAGQQDTFLNVIGKAAVLKHITKCWASLFTERAVTYRIQNGFDHRKVYLSVVVQKMVFPQASGIIFTADPVTSNRKVITIDAGFGLGEALVSGLVNPDIYRVRDGKFVDKKISTKQVAIRAVEGGGTKVLKTAPEMENRQVLTDDQIFQLERLGRIIEAYFGSPQDIEWCMADGKFHIVQSRPITTLYPIPEANDDENHVYLSVGHQQMMTDPLKPLGMDLMRLIAYGRWHKAGGRLFIDVSQMLATKDGRALLLRN